MTRVGPEAGEVGAARDGVGMLLRSKGSGVLEEVRGGQMLKGEGSQTAGGGRAKAFKVVTPGMLLIVGKSLAAQSLSLPICIVGVRMHPHRGGMR